jgi:hypothetical protein
MTIHENTVPKIIHLTDTHICPEGETVIGLDPRARLLAAFESINRRHADADLCVITGDLTDRGDTESYKILRLCLEQLRLPWRLLLGNHDDRANFLSVFPDASTDSAGFVQSIEDIDGSRLIFLDTLDSELDGGGTLCRERMLWLERNIGESGKGPVFLFMHHPPRSVGVRYFDHMLLSNGDSFMTLVAARPAVSHIAFGHLHLTAAGSWCAASFSCNRGTCHKIALSLSEMRAEYVRTGPAYDIMLMDDGATTVHHVDPAGEMELLAVEYPDQPGGRIEYPAGGTAATVEL